VVDVLSELLAPMRLTGLYYSRWTVSAPWAVSGDADAMAVVHYVQAGSVYLELSGAHTVIEAGDLAVFPHGDAHYLGDAPGRAATSLAELIPDRGIGGAGAVVIDGSGEPAVMLCAGLGYRRESEVGLYRSLPSMIILRSHDIAEVAMLSGALDQLSSDWIRHEPGGYLIALRAYELVFLLAIRSALRTAASSRGDSAPRLWRALSDPGIGAALRAMHSDYDRPWTVATLAAEAGLSRSAFAARFRSSVGSAPMRYLTEQRLRQAAALLAETRLSHDRIARRVGYRSATGLHLAFKEVYGMAPGHYRRAVR